MTPEFWISLTWAMVVLIVLGVSLWAYRTDQAKKLDSLEWAKIYAERNITAILGQIEAINISMAETKEDVGKLRMAQGFGKHQ